jgi:hypothetical protein
MNQFFLKFLLLGFDQVRLFAKFSSCDRISFLAFMVLDTGYEDRFFRPDSDACIIFLLFGVTMTILVNNLLTGKWNRIRLTSH